ncbi:hypothetical protein JHK85_009638 [Glycine max]|nr:hypothetical protein JHK85_009638 [Glycine max]KAG5065651.1 hypothetical protein JHK86_009382 [Glycine max]
MDSCDVEELPSKMLKIDKKPTKLTRGKFCKEFSTISPNVEPKLDFHPMEVTRRPNDEDRSKWFKDILWEEKMKTAYEQGRLMLLQNLDPSLSSSEVQKDAVSTSHCSRPNNIEYDMGIEWCLLQERANKSW